MVETTYAVLALVPVIASLLYYQLLRYRSRYAHIPTVLKPNLFLGCVPYMIEGFKKFGDSKIHPGASDIGGQIFETH